MTDEDEQRLIGRVIDVLVEPAMAIDTVGIVRHVNPAAEQLFGWNASEFRMKPLAAFMPEPFRSQHQGYVERFMTERTAKIVGRRREVIALRRDGTTVTVELSVSILPGPGADGQPLFLGVLRDITRRKRLEAEMRAARSRLETAHKARNDFLREISHELRTPLNAILGFAEIMKEGIFGPMPDTYAGYVVDIHEGGTRMLDFLGRLEATVDDQGPAALHEETVDIAEILVDVHGLALTRAKEGGVQLVTQSDPSLPRLWADRRMVKQLASKLFAHALDQAAVREVTTAAMVVDNGELDVMVQVQCHGGSPADPRTAHPIDLTLEDNAIAVARTLIEMHGGSLLRADGSGGDHVLIAAFPAERCLN